MIQKCIKQIIIPNHKPKKRKSTYNIIQICERLDHFTNLHNEICLFLVKLMDWKKYHRLNVIYAFIDDLERDYPAICTVTTIGKSVEGRDIKVKGTLFIHSLCISLIVFNTSWRSKLLLHTIVFFLLIFYS